MIIDEIRKKKAGVVLGILMMAAMCTGCGEESVSNVELGMEACKNLEYDTAISYFETAIEQGESRRLSLRGEGISYLGKTEYDKAIDCFVSALNESDGQLEAMDYDMNYYLATAYFKNGQPEAAINVYNAIIGMKPKEKDAFYLRGTVELSTGDYATAQTDFEQAIALEPNNYDQMIDVYNVLSEYGYREAGEDILQNVVDNAPSSMSDFDKGRFYFYLADYANAKSFLESAKKGNESGVVYFLGKTYEALGDYNYAISIYNSYLAEHSDEPDIYNQMGLCQMKMEKYEEALNSFQTAMRIEGNPMMQTLKFNEIVAYEYLQDYQTAATLMGDYLKNYPDDEVAKRENKFLKTR